jgi:hypothetical protein
MTDTNHQTLNQQRLLASVYREPASGCWLWRGQISNTGYGRMMVTAPDGRSLESAHRASYAAFVGPIPERGVVRQTCGNRLCINPEHLEMFMEASLMH